MKFFAVLATLMVAAVAVDNSTYACMKESDIDKQVPACAVACQQQALHADGCTDYDDISCHCKNTGAVANILTPCLANSTCSGQDLAGKCKLLSAFESHIL